MNQNNISLDVAIATHGEEGVRRVASMLPPLSEGVRYVVSWQRYAGIEVPESLAVRSDVEIVRCDAPGLSNNRNNALGHCAADIVLIADDDLVYRKDAFRMVREEFAKHPDMDVALFKVSFPVPKVYPEKPCRIGMPFPKGYYVTSFEMAFRRGRIENLRFHPGLGIGNARYGAGEDEFFLISAIKRGLSCRYTGIEICAHPQLSTGLRNASAAVIRSSGALIAIMFPWSAVLRLPLKAWRLRKGEKSGFFKALWHLVSGAVQAGSIMRAPRCYRW